MLRNHPLSQTPERLVVNLFKEKYCICSIQELEFKMEWEPVQTAEQKIAVQQDRATKCVLITSKTGGMGVAGL